MSNTDQLIQRFLEGSPHAVVGASQDRSKYGNKVFRAYLQNGRPVFPINPRAGKIEGFEAFPHLGALPEPVHGISVIVPPSVTVQVLEKAAAQRIANIWLQPGSENELVLSRAEELGLELISSGPCLLVALGFRETVD